MKIFSSILIVVNVYFNPYVFASRLSKSEEIQKLSGFIDYGNWCGPGHGGYQDCCNGEPCSSCNLKDGKPSKSCLLECQPIDELDYHCALHDECCINNENDINCNPEGNYCACDCLLTEGALKATDCNDVYCKSYRSTLVYIFENTLSCWYNNVNNTASCNKVFDKDYETDNFCQNGVECKPWDTTC
jgi:hypothetical protein